MAAHLLKYPLPVINSSGDPVVGGSIEFYEAGGSSTAKEVFSDYTLSTSAGTSVDLDSLGLPEKSGTSIEVYGTGNYYCIVKNAAGSTVRDFEWLEENDTATAADEWTASGLTPTYISGTQFSVTGDQTATLHVGRMLKIQLSSSTIYRRITASAFSSVTTITVATGLTDPITSFEYGFLAFDNPSYAVQSDIFDSNGNEVIIRGETASAVNEVTVTNAASSGKPAITQSGADDVGIDIEGVELHNGVITADNLYRKYLLDTPELLITSSSTSDTNWTTYDMSAGGTEAAAAAALGASKAILKVYTHIVSNTTTSTGDIQKYVFFAKSGQSGAPPSGTSPQYEAQAIVVNKTGTGSLSVYGRSLVPYEVNLDANSDFQYAIDISNFGLTVSATVTYIYLVGYYV